MSVTRVLVERDARQQKPVLGYFTLTTVLAEATNWPGVAKGLPRMPVPVVLLARLAVGCECKLAAGARVMELWQRASGSNLTSQKPQQYPAETLPQIRGKMISRKAAKAQRKRADRKRGTATIGLLDCSFWPSDLAHFDASEEFENLSLHLEIGS
jgi:hypothetical protein